MIVEKEFKIIVTPLQKEDQSAVRQLIYKGLEEHWGTIDTSLNPDLIQIWETYAEGNFLVARMGSEIVGTGALIQYSEDIGQIVRMSVSPYLRRKGIGTKVLNALVALGRRKGYRKLILETTETWMDVILFYEAYGFQITHYKMGDVYFEFILS